jgi:hypothetical protein
MDHLFDAELRYQDGLPPIVPVEDAGELVGSGIGRVDGPRLHGTLRWSNFERTWSDYCQLTLAGEVETDDGAIIHFDSRGFALPQTAGTCKVASAVRFVVDDARYQWLQSRPAVWEGEFAATAGTARYRAYLPGGSDARQHRRCAWRLRHRSRSSRGAVTFRAAPGPDRRRHTRADRGGRRLRCRPARWVGVAQQCRPGRLPDAGGGDDLPRL